MPIKSFFPYAYTDQLVSLDIKPDVPDVPISTVSAFQCYESDADEICFSCTVSADSESVVELLPELERSSPPVVLVLVIESIESRVRRAIPIDGMAGRITQNFKKSEWSGEVTLTAQIVRTNSSKYDSREFATSKGNVIGQSDPIRLLFDPPKNPPGLYLKLKWVKFPEGSPRLRKYPDNVFALDEEENAPVLYLNESLPTLRTVMDSRGTRHIRAAARDAFFGMVFLPVWTSLIQQATFALSEVINEEEDIAPEDLSELAGGWKSSVIDYWIPEIYADAGGDIEAMAKYQAALESPRLLQEFYTELVPDALQKNGAVEVAYRSLIREVRATRSPRT